MKKFSKHLPDGAVHPMPLLLFSTSRVFIILVYEQEFAHLHNRLLRCSSRPLFALILLLCMRKMIMKKTKQGILLLNMQSIVTNIVQQIFKRHQV